ILMPIRGPENPIVVVGEGAFAAAVHVDDVKLQVVLLLAVAAKDNALAVGREERSAVVAAGGARELPHVAAVGVHDVQLEVLLTRAIGAEDDLLAVGRIGAFGVVAG